MVVTPHQIVGNECTVVNKLFFGHEFNKLLSTLLSSGLVSQEYLVYTG